MSNVSFSSQKLFSSVSVSPVSQKVILPAVSGFADVMSSKSSVATCCVERDESLQKKKCRLKFFNNMWWSSNALTMNRMIFDNVNELSFNVYEMSDELYTLCMRIIFVSSSISLTIILSTLKSIVKYLIFQFSMFI
jgi:hypothetical protein